MVVKGVRQNLDIFITCVYVSLTHDLQERKVIRDILRTYHDFLRNHRTSHHILVGDLNSRHELWSFEKADSCGRIIANSLLHLRMISAIPPTEKSWTRMDPTTGRQSWIDAFLTTPKLHQKITKSYISESSFSDHRMINVLFSDLSPRKRLNMKELNILAKGVDLGFMKNLPDNSKQADESFSKLESIMIDITKASFDLPTRSDIFVYPQNLSRTLRKCTRRHEKFQITRIRFPYQIPKLARLCLDEIDRFNIKKIPKIFKSIRFRRERKKLKCIIERKGEWAVINRLLGKEFKRESPDIGNTVPPCSSQLDVTLEEVSKKHTNKVINLSPDRALKVIFDFSGSMNESLEAQSLVKSTVSKSCCYDNFLSCRSLNAIMKYHGRILFNYIAFCVASGYTPQLIKKSRIQLIPKKDPGKFRPLSILHPLYRAFDAIVFWVLSRNIDPKLLEYQFGFLKKCNAIDFHHCLKLQIDLLLRDNLPFVIISIDLSDAFEKISFEAIKCGLKKHGICEELIRIVIGHIINRQSFILEADKKKWYTHTSGAPQGGFLSPLAFIIGLSIIWDLATYGFRIMAYADDIIILAQPDSMQSWKSMHERLIKLENLLRAMNLTINASKSKVIAANCDKKITIKIGETELPTSEYLDILGVKLKFDHQRKRMINKLKLMEKLDGISRKFTAFSTKIRSLSPLRAHLVITSTIKGVLMYFGCLIRLWVDYNTFHEECKKAMNKVGGIIKTAMGFKLGMNHITIFYVFFREHLAILIERILNQHLNSNEKLKAKPKLLIDTPYFDPYGINIIPLGRTSVNFKKVNITRLVCDFTQPTISYQRCQIKFDHWIRTMVSIDDEIVSTKVFCFWTHSSSYLDCLEEAIYQTIVTCKHAYMSQVVAIKADNGLRKRLINCKNRSRFSDLLSAKKFKIALEVRSNRKFFRPSERDMKTIPRICVEGSKQYWEIMNIYDHLKEAELYSSNIIFSSLLFSRFRIFKNWQKVMRVDFYSLALLLGLWRNNDYMRACPKCGEEINTRKILFGCCTFIPRLKCKATVVTEKNIVRILSTLMTFRILAANFRANLELMRIDRTAT